MIEIKPFTLDDISKYESFYLLRDISNVEEIEVFHNTPSGQVQFPKISALSMPNGAIVVAWPGSINMAQFYNLTVVANGISEIVSLNSIDRVIDIYNKSVNSNFGVFCFGNSNVILEPNIDWRCDNGKYGPGTFPPNVKLVSNPENIVIFEPILSITGVAHLLYLEYTSDPNIGNDHVNNAEKPILGRTLWECLKLIREWSIVNGEPFNNDEIIARKAAEFMNSFNFTQEELNSIDGQTAMQIAKYISGDNNARLRPEDVIEINNDIRNIVFRRLSSGCLSAIEYLNPGMWNIDELIQAEKEDLIRRREIFSEKLGNLERPQNYVDLQNRLFNNREIILSKIENGEF